MKNAMLTIALLLAGCANAPAAVPSGNSVGMQTLSAPVSGDVPVKLALWYPSSAPPKTERLGPYTLDVAMAGAVKKGRHPLILISHGTGGSSFGHFNLAIALAQAGYVVAALDHTGDTYANKSRSFGRSNFAGRPAQARAALDYLLKDWRSHDQIDPARIGMFGHSAGGATALIVAGGRLDWGLVEGFCQNHMEDWGCRNAAAAGRPSGGTGDISPVIAPDPRIKALVIAAPALAHGFTADGMRAVKVPVQLWVAQQDEVVPDAGQFRALLPKKPELHLVNPGGHFGFLPPCTITLRMVAGEICNDPEGFDRSAFQAEFARQVAGFFRSKLSG